jgi:DNA polymerase-3 subunit alpha
MDKRTKSDIDFVNLHGHSVAGSMFDGLGYPPEHMDYAYSNGCSALALTDHGNMNGLAWQVLHAKKMGERGHDFKPIYGVEAYFVPSIAQWREEYEQTLKDKKKARAARKGNTSGATVEDESQSKKASKNILNRRRHLVLLAQNQKGLNNLFKLVSESYKSENFYRYPRIDYSLLEQYSEGVIAASACLGGVYAGCMWENGIYDQDGKMTGCDEEGLVRDMRGVTERMLSIFGERWFGELQWNNIPEQHRLNKYIIQMHKEYGIPLISTADSHYPDPDAWKDRELYRRLGWLGKGRPSWAEDGELPISVEEIGYELYPKNGDQMWESYKKYSQECGITYDDKIVLNSLEETHRIATKMIQDFYPDNTVRLPDFVIPTGETADSALESFCIEGLRQKNLHTDIEYTNRLKYELSVIADRGFSKYFLTMDEVAHIANQIMLTGTGRGSGAGSLVAYALGITQVDPIRWNLQFERFLRSDATDYPDIDYDVAEPMALKDELIEKWGDNVVAPISNWNTLQLKSLVKDISKLYGIPFTEVNNVTGKMIFEATGPAKERHGIKSGVYNPTFEEVKEFSPTLQRFLTTYPQVADHIDTLYGQVRSCSRHAGGVVIAEDLDKHMPLISSKNVRQTPWSEGQNVRHLEPMGFIKFDLLGLSTLRMVDGAIRHILRRHHGIEAPTFKDVKEYYDKNLHPDVIDLDNQEVYENIFHKGRWAGLFQFTESGVQVYCTQVKPRSIIGLATITSTYRPGPLAAKVHDQFLEAKENPQNVRYVNEVHREVTEETYGFLIFQEQIALLAHKLGKDLTLDEGNKLRKVLTKKGTGKEARVKNRLLKKFIDGCLESGLRRTTAERLWETFEYFSGYGFNKSHAVSYSILSYQCAWLLNYYPAEWMAAFLDKEPESRKEKALSIAKSFGFAVDPVNINTSGKVWEISPDGRTLIQPLSSIKGMGDAAIQQVLDNRPFKEIEDFLFNENIVYSKLNKKCLDVLVRSEALDCLMDSRFTGRKHFWSAVAVDRARSRKKFNSNIETYSPEGCFTLDQEIQNIISLTGRFPLDRVMTKDISKALEDNFIPPLSEYDPELAVAWVIPRSVKKKTTKRGDDYYEVEGVDSNSKPIKIRCWGISIQRGDKINTNVPYIIRPNYSPNWGFSTTGRISRYWQLLA